MDQIPPKEDQPRFELIDDHIKSESGANSPHLHATDPAPQPPPKSSPNPLPSTETADISDSPAAMAQPKKKGTASSAKKAPKRPKAGGDAKKPKKAKPTPSTAPAADEADEEDDDGTDNGPYCLCRGPDDHRWMICCEKCEDWFHGECINMDKTIGESLIEKFVCPNCSRGDQVTVYKKTCALGACKKAARLTQTPSSVFCSNDHAQMWWERTVTRLPKGRARSGLDDQLAQEELMALLNSELAGVDGDGAWKLAKAPFAGELPQEAKGSGPGTDDPLSHVLSDEEKAFLDHAANIRFQLAEETLLCHKMISLIEFAQERRRSAITAGRFGEDTCGYDERLDSISARDAFAAFVKSPGGEAIFKASKLGDPEGTAAVGACERKRCKVHAGWQKMLTLGIKHQIREMAGQAAEVAEEERIMREAAGERWKRKRAERNRVEVLEG